MEKKLSKKIIFLISIIFIGNLFAQKDFEDYQKTQEKQFAKFVTMDKKAYEEYAKADREAFAKFKNEMEEKWGNFATSSRKDWVEYSNNNETRSIVDFEKGSVKIEILIPKDNPDNEEMINKKLLEAIKELAFAKGKTKDYEIPNEKPIAFSDKPVLENQLQMKNGEIVNNQNIEKYSKEILDNSQIEQVEMELKKDKTKKKKGSETFETKQPEFLKYSISLELAPENIQERAKQHLPYMKKYATYYDLPLDLVMAMIHTESFYNPKARSYIPAYGLMQLVPRTAAYEAYEYVYDKKKMLPANYLYNPKNNIELGTAYLYRLKTHYFKNVENSKSRNYCIIAAYNTGSGNVNRAFGSKNLQDTAKKINAMTSEQVYNVLRTQLPFTETRKYMKKVTDRRAKYRSWGI
ncbi:MAG: murein transglycosylase domain-containing protein [Candidatus Marinimicrobia bacterium]|nr:murein transglycosylase domain-containing protein [Candidatus Neomarinimicrobiota bacterium]